MALSQIEGGSFVNCEGQPLASGYLIVQLSHDSYDSSTDVQVVAGLARRIQLDNVGNIAGEVYLEANSSLSPPNSYYVVNAFTSDGRTAWRSPQYWVIPTTPDPFNVGSLVPTNPPGSGLEFGESITLQTNGTNNASQSLLNLTAGTNITLTNTGGEVEIDASGGSPTYSTAGEGYFYGPGMLFAPPNTMTDNDIVSSSNQVYAAQFIFLVTMTIRNISYRFSSGSGGTHGGFGIYNAAGTSLLITTGAMNASVHTVQTVSITPVTLSPGVYWFAQTADDNGVKGAGFGILSTDPMDIANAVAPRFALCSNAGSAGVLPATLGTFSAQDSFEIATPVFEP